MKKLTTGLKLRALGLLLTGVTVMGVGGNAMAQEPLDTSTMYLVPKDELPRFGTFWLAFGPGGKGSAPWPCPPENIDAPIYRMENGQFLVDDSNVDYGLKNSSRMSLLSLNSPPTPPGGGGGSNNPPSSPPNLSNHEKYLGHTFTVLDTNSVSLSDTNLYNFLLSLPSSTNTAPHLQIAQYATNIVIIKANHFDYSGETTRDFALLVGDRVEAPLWKTIDVTSTNYSDGWLVQGTVSNRKVVDPMFLMVSNVNNLYPTFYQAIPYGGPQLQIVGPEPYETVSNIITLSATITDLSGVTNEQLQVTVDGYPARYSIGTSNTISLDTRYNNVGPISVYLTAFNTSARVYDTNNPPDRAKTSFSTIASLPLEFQNETFLVFASDMCSPDVGTNYIVFAIDKAQQIEATITDPSNGQILASYADTIPNAATIYIPWNFTCADGITPYTNDSYAVTFIAYDPTTLIITNKIDRVGVREGAGTFLTYQWEDPSFINPDGQWINDQADTWIKQTLAYLYNDLYDRLGLTQYYPWMVGANRNRGDCYPRDAWSLSWHDILRRLTNSYYSELTLGPAHGSGSAIGGGSYLTGTFNPLDLKRYIVGVGGQNWRLRKANLWTCYSGDVYLATGGFYNTSWADACGIRPKGLQEISYMRKNCGLFFGAEINQRGYAGSDGTISCAKVEETCDQIWVCGQFMYPGGCDPTYSFEFAVNATRGMFNPELDQASPLLYGYKYMIYTSVYDDMLMLLNTSLVKTQ